LCILFAFCRKLDKQILIIQTRNEQTYIKDLLDSLVTQTEPPYEIIIIDAESTDDTQRIVRQYMRKYDFIKLYIEKGTRGEGRNSGAYKATGDIIAFIDADCIANAFWIQEFGLSGVQWPGARWDYA
jgi:glycosyltransferase involved in cell wall biosynthesis